MKFLWLLILPFSTCAATYYVNPSTGSDSNNGLSSGAAWLSVAKINSSSGLFSSGDTLIIDTTASNLLLGTNAMRISTQGLNLVQLGGGRTGTGEIQAWKTLANASFSLTSGTTKVYQITDAEVSIVPWENEMWMNHVTGATLASVTNALQTTAGSFWTDGTTLYIHPFGDTNPTTDGKTYTRSIHRVPPTGQSAVQITAPDVNVSGLRVRKTCLADQSSSDSVLAYCLQAYQTFGGTSLIENCYFDYSAKHGLGITDGSSNSSVTIQNVECEQGTPYSNHTPFVSFNGSGSATNNQHFYINCVSTKDTGLIGSTNGVSGVAEPFYVHNSSGSGQFSLISFDGCEFGIGMIGGTDAVISLVVNNTKFGGDNQSGAKNKTFTRCLWNRVVPNQNRLDGVLVIQNCLIVPTGTGSTAITDTLTAVEGNVTAEGNTYDLRGSTSSVNFPGLVARSDATVLTFRNNVILFPVKTGASATDWNVYKNFTTGDTITANNNLYFTQGQTVIAKNYDSSDRSFAQWQALGFDVSSLNTNPMLNTANRPIPGSPAIGAGIDLGPMQDYSGVTFQVRDTIGAYEYVGLPASSVSGRVITSGNVIMR